MPLSYNNKIRIFLRIEVSTLCTWLPREPPNKIVMKAICNVQENPWGKSKLSVGKSKAPWHSSAIKI